MAGLDPAILREITGLILGSSPRTVMTMEEAFAGMTIKRSPVMTIGQLSQQKFSGWRQAP
jgi:hypothetical protein